MDVQLDVVSKKIQVCAKFAQTAADGKIRQIEGELFGNSE
jgi:hypothetical protein